MCSIGPFTEEEEEEKNKWKNEIEQHTEKRAPKWARGTLGIDENESKANRPSSRAIRDAYLRLESDKKDNPFEGGSLEPYSALHESKT